MSSVLKPNNSYVTKNKRRRVFEIQNSLHIYILSNCTLRMLVLSATCSLNVKAQNCVNYTIITRRKAMFGAHDSILYTHTLFSTNGCFLFYYEYCS